MAFSIYSTGTDSQLVDVSNSTSFLHNVISYESPDGILVDTSYTEFAGDHTIAINAYMVDYPAIESDLIPTTIRFKFCDVLDVIASQIETVKVPP